MEQVLKTLTLDFFGRGKHKTTPEIFFGIENGFLLDVRAREEAESITINLQHHKNIECKNIPTDEIPDRINEIPQDKSIAVCCSGMARSAVVYAYLLSKGFGDIHILEGGYSAITEALKPGKILKVIHNKQ